jgi:regulator of RNase E activity RraA
VSQELIKKFDGAETGAVTDSMRLVGATGWLEGMLPANPKLKMSGRAFTILCAHTTPSQEGFNMYALLDTVAPGDVVVISADTDAAFVGENMMHFMANKKLGGMVLEGLTRDFGVISGMDIPHFSRGRAVKLFSPDFKPIAVNVPVSCGGVVINPGDYIVGDADGVIALSPADAEKVAYQLVKVADVETRMEEALNRFCSVEELMAIVADKKVPRE